jgi:hypothetical protein
LILFILLFIINIVNSITWNGLKVFNYIKYIYKLHIKNRYILYVYNIYIKSISNMRTNSEHSDNDYLSEHTNDIRLLSLVIKTR